MREGANQRVIWAAVSSMGRSVLFRLNSGIAWATGGGKVRRIPGTNDMVVPNARPIALGFARSDNRPQSGPGDLIGWHSMVITPEMVGRRIAVFMSVETKRTGGGEISDDQLKWQANVVRDGGIAIITDSPADAQRAVNEFMPPIANSIHNRHPG